MKRPAHAQGAPHTHSATHTHSIVRVTTAASETEGVAAVSWIESLMIRRPFGSIDPNSIRETELHTVFRRRHSRGERESLPRPQLHRDRDAARQRAAATRRRETDEARAERLQANRQRKATRRQQDTTQAREARCVCVSVLGCVYPCVYPSCARWLLGKKFCCKRVFAL